MVLGTSYDVFVVHKLHLDPVESLDGKSGSILRDDGAENENSNIKYRIRSDEQTPLLAGATIKNVQEPHEIGIGNVSYS